jgi:arylsulfatase A-like enzyme
MKHLLLATLLFSLSAHHLRAAESFDQPNIVLIMADDMGYSDLGCYGGEIETPNLNALAKGGLRFTNFYTNNMCVPTRASLLNGTYDPVAYRNKTLSNRVVTIAQLLHHAGYATAMSGKWHQSNDKAESNQPPQRGFEKFYGTLLGAGSFFAPASLKRNNKSAEHEWKHNFRYYYTDAISENAVQFIQATEKKRPLFLYVTFTAAHWPLHAFEEDIAKYKGRYDIGWDELRRRRHRRMKELGVVNPNWSLSLRNPEVPAWDDADHKQWQVRRMEVYAAQIDRMDRGIGRIVAALKSSGRFENTLILYLQDNGGCHVEYLPDRKGAYLPDKTRDGKPLRPGNLPSIMPGPEDTYQSYGYGWANVSNTPFRLYKLHTHEGGIRTPLIAHWPKGITSRGELSGQVGHIIDLMPTCLELAAVDYPEQYHGNRLSPLDGKSLLPIFKGNSRKPHDTLFWNWSRGRAVRKGKWKLVALRNKPWELYDLNSDGTELNNLAEQLPEKVAELSGLFDEWVKRTKK